MGASHWFGAAVSAVCVFSCRLPFSLAALYWLVSFIFLFASSFNRLASDCVHRCSAPVFPCSQFYWFVVSIIAMSCLHWFPLFSSLCFLHFLRQFLIIFPTLSLLVLLHRDLGCDFTMCSSALLLCLLSLVGSNSEFPFASSRFVGPMFGCLCCPFYLVPTLLLFHFYQFASSIVVRSWYFLMSSLHYENVTCISLHVTCPHKIVPTMWGPQDS